MRNNTIKIILNRIITVALSLLLIFMLLEPQTAIAENDTPEYDGYIVSLDKNANVDIDDKDSELEEIVKDEIYQADTISDIMDEIPAEDIKYIEPNYVIELCDTYTPNDAKYPESRWAQDIMNVQKAWERGYFGNYSNSSDAPTVGIIDTGIMGAASGAKHEDLNYSNISSGKNTVNGSQNSNDDYGHGTFIAGIIAGVHNNGVGIAGDMPNFKLRAYKCVNKGGDGTVAQEVAAIYAAIADGVDVINISLKLGGDLVSEQTAINEATSKGIIVCAAAGNSSSTRYIYPASHNNVISVGSVNSFMNRSSFSQHNDMVDCAAPGEDILSLDFTKTNAYKTSKGTSFSCPQVVALAAMCKSIDSTINHDRFIELLKSTSRDAGFPGYDISYGWGIIDYGNMLDALVPESNSIWKGTISGFSEKVDYTGSEITFDNLKITMPGGKVLSADSDYTVAYYNNKEYKTGMMTIQGIGDYTGRINKYFTINGAPKDNYEKTGSGEWYPTPYIEPDPVVEPEPIIDPEPVIKPVKIKAPTIKKLTAGKKSFKLTWKKVSSIDGYRLQYSTTKTFKKGTYKTKTVAKSKTSYTVKKLNSKKKYYVRIRSYKNVDGKPYYSKWTSMKSIKVR